MEYKYQSL